MNRTFIVITAQAKISRNGDTPPHLDGIPTYHGESFCSLIEGVIGNICQRMSVKLIQSECFETDRRMAIIIRADATDLAGSLDTLRAMLELAGEKIHATVRVQKEDLFRYMHRI